MTISPGAPGDLAIGDTIREALRVAVREAPLLLFLSLLLAGIPSLIADGLSFPGMPLESLSEMEQLRAASFIALVPGVVLQGALISAVVSSLTGGAPRLLESLRVGARRSVPVFLYSLVYGLGVALGLLLLVFPGLLLGVIGIVGAPAIVMEGTGVRAAFQRSSDLTRGSRWRIAGLYLVFALIGIGLLLIVLIPATLLVMLMGQTESPATTAIVAALTAMVIDVLAAAIVGTLYVNLKRRREGIGLASQADVFA